MMERLFFLTDAACDCDVNAIDLPRVDLTCFGVYCF